MRDGSTAGNGLGAKRDSPPWGAGSRGASWFTESWAHVAQSAERVLGKDEVISSILIVGSNLSGGTREKFEKG